MSLDRNIMLDSTDDKKEAVEDLGVIQSMRYTPGQRVSLADYARNEMRRLGLHSGSYLSWRKLSYSVMSSRYPCNLGQTVIQPLLKDVSGYVKPGMLLLLLGPPGSGKTSLLEILAGRKRSGVPHIQEGEVLVDGKPWSRHFNRIAGYVTQEDVHFPTLTVRETFEFSSLLRNHPSVPYEKKMERVDVVLDLLGLSHVADTIVGNTQLRGVSGGEKKRVSIGVELVTGPSILFMDEPTTGLDSQAALEVLQHLRTLADVGIPVVCSLLQPAQDIYDLFDHVLVLSNREAAFFGPTNQVLEYFESIGFRSPPGKNTAEFLLEVCTSKGQIYKFPGGPPPVPPFRLGEAFKESASYRELGDKLWKGVAPAKGTRTAMPSQSSYSSSKFKQIALCTKRALTNMFRNPAALRFRAVRSLIMGLMLGTLFFNLPKTFLGASNRVSLCFFTITFTAMGSIASIPQVCEERHIFYHQRAAHFYKTIGYFASTILVDLPLSIVETVLYGVPVYILCNLNWGDYGLHFLNFMIIVWATNLLAKQFCRWMAASTPNIRLASAVAPAGLCVWLVFAGFLIPRNTMPIYYKWVNIISPFRYTLESLAINELETLENFSCESADKIPPINDTEYVCQTCPISNGVEELEAFGLETTAEWIYIDMTLLWVCYILFCVLSFISLALLNFYTPKRKAEGNGGADSSSDEDDYEEDAPLLGGQPEYETNANYKKRSPNSVESSYEGAATVSFHKLDYTVQLPMNLRQRFGGAKKEQFMKQLLHGVNGYCKPGTMLALMGATGAGKSTLLDVLSNRKTGGFHGGEILFNGKPRDIYTKRMIGYCEQFNVHLPTLTVRETLRYSADMRLDRRVSDAERNRRVDEVLTQIGLDHVKHRMVGDPSAGGISPELSKKLAIGIELVANPAVLFLDEPTSGLDSQAAEAVMYSVRRVCDTGVPVICTIHQPSAELFMLFDALLLLKPGGHVIYFGDMGDNAKTCLDYFARHGMRGDPSKNPADFVISCSGAGIGGLHDDLVQDTVGDFDPLAAWLSSEEATNLEAELTAGVGHEGTGLQHTDEFAKSLFEQIFYTCKRSWTHKWRQKAALFAYLLLFGVMGVLIGSLYFDLGLTQSGARNRVALIYFSIVFAGLAALPSIPNVITMREIYYREKPSYMRPLAFFISIVTVELPYVIICSSIYAVLIYVMAVLNFEQYGLRFLWFIFVYVTSCMTSIALAQLIGILAPTQEAANTIFGVLLSIFSLFAGFLIPKGSIGWWWIWLHYLSFFSYSLESITIDQFSDISFTCNTDQYIYVPDNASFCSSPCLPQMENSTNVTMCGGQYCCQSYCPIGSGSVFISTYFQMHTTMTWAFIDEAILLAMYFSFLFFTYIGVKYVSWLRK